MILGLHIHMALDDRFRIFTLLVRQDPCLCQPALRAGVAGMSHRAPGKGAGEDCEGSPGRGVPSRETGMQTEAFPGGRDLQPGMRSSAHRAFAWGIRRPLSGGL